MSKPCQSQSGWGLSDAETLARLIHELARWPKNHPNSGRYASAGLLKLPPALLQGDTAAEGSGRHRNLVAMIRVVSDYQGQQAGDGLTLAELPALFNEYGGRPILSESATRKVHNWVQQVSFALRAAVMEQEMRAPTRGTGWDTLTVADRVVKRLYSGDGPRLSFVTRALDNPYELKPLRYASLAAIRRWVEQEHQQRIASAGSRDYGASPTPQEWKNYGLRGQKRTIYAAFEAHVEAYLVRASTLDAQKQWRDADKLDGSLVELGINLDQYTRWEKTAAR